MPKPHDRRATRRFCSRWQSVPPGQRRKNEIVGHRDWKAATGGDVFGWCYFLDPQRQWGFVGAHYRCCSSLGLADGDACPPRERALQAVRGRFYRRGLFIEVAWPSGILGKVYRRTGLGEEEKGTRAARAISRSLPWITFAAAEKRVTILSQLHTRCRGETTRQVRVG